MSSLADAPDLVGFFSYSREDDEGSGGKLSKLRERIQEELRGQLGRTKRDFRLWQDKTAIAHGELWEDRIKTAIAESVFFIPIITPTAVRSYHCKFEFDSFLAREKELGRSNLVFPILYISVPALTDDRWRNDPLLSIVGSRQYEQWQNLRQLDPSSTEVALRVEKFCANICRALEQEWLSPEQRREAEARRVAEAERRRQQEAEIKQFADEEERRRKADAEKRRRDEEERRRQEAVAKLEAEQKQAFAAAKHADSVGAIDAFLANHSESRHTTEARTLRAALVARDEACRKAMASDDPAVLKAFLKTYPKSTPAPQVRERLRHLEPRKVWPISRHAVLVGLSVLAATGLLLVGWIGLYQMGVPVWGPWTPRVEQVAQKGPKGERGPPGLAGPRGPYGPAGRGGTVIRLVLGECRQACTVACEANERILDTYAINPGGTFVFEDEGRATFRPPTWAGIAVKIVLVCVSGYRRTAAQFEESSP